MLKIIAKNVAVKLEKIVRGKVSCHFVKKDMISIEVSNGRVFYRFTRWYSETELYNGLNSTDIVGEFLESYTTYIRNKFFKI